MVVANGGLEDKGTLRTNCEGAVSKGIIQDYDATWWVGVVGMICVGLGMPANVHLEIIH